MQGEAIGLKVELEEERRRLEAGGREARHLRASLRALGRRQEAADRKLQVGASERHLPADGRALLDGGLPALQQVGIPALPPTDCSSAEEASLKDRTACPIGKGLTAADPMTL